MNTTLSEGDDEDQEDSMAGDRFSQIYSQRTRIAGTTPGDDDLKGLVESERSAVLQARRAERERQIKRYQRASLAYIHSILKSHPDDANDVWGQVVIKWLEGKLHGYNREYSFRKYLKEILRNEVRAIYRNRQEEPERLGTEFDPQDEGHRSASSAFDDEYRNALLARAMNSVRQTDDRFFTLLQAQIDASVNGQKEPRASALAELLDVTVDNARAIRKRARDAYAKAILNEVREDLGTTDADHVREALQDLGLEAYCRRVLE